MGISFSGQVESEAPPPWEPEPASLPLVEPPPHPAQRRDDSRDLPVPEEAGHVVVIDLV
jgi:hypothetical protein